ncbi:hypothetical protein RHMOL_Rhmol04G0194000 [Rhododendron molle]|uniref:Uncharacterized protein n=1 Tax=Rhododendron molle TaxID=49168 RepID=A0ACC0P3A7_RHOML|nr:hypothetical protein RHMOL_Rhmol04G0194000 [Rhododendron molle]
MEEEGKKARRHEVIEFDRETGIYEVRTPLNPTGPYKGNHRHTIDFKADMHLQQDAAMANAVLACDCSV